MNELVANFAEAFLRPRNSALRILAAARDWKTTLLLGLLAFSLQMLLTLVTRTVLGIGPIPDAAEQPAGPGGITPLGMALLQFAIVGMAFGVGRLFGGRANFREIVAVLSWYGVATSALVPVEIAWIYQILSGAQSSLLIAFGIGLRLFALWILANFIAAAHGFRNAFSVMLCIVATLFLLGFGLEMALRGGG